MRLQRRIFGRRPSPELGELDGNAQQWGGLDPVALVERVIVDLAPVAIVLGAVERKDDPEIVLGNDGALEHLGRARHVLYY